MKSSFFDPWFLTIDTTYQLLDTIKSEISFLKYFMAQDLVQDVDMSFFRKYL